MRGEGLQQRAHHRVEATKQPGNVLHDSESAPSAPAQIVWHFKPIRGSVCDIERRNRNVCQTMLCTHLINGFTLRGRMVCFGGVDLQESSLERAHLQSRQLGSHVQGRCRAFKAIHGGGCGTKTVVIDVPRLKRVFRDRPARGSGTEVIFLPRK